MRQTFTSVYSGGLWELFAHTTEKETNISGKGQTRRCRSQPPQSVCCADVRGYAVLLAHRNGGQKALVNYFPRFVSAAGTKHSNQAGHRTPLRLETWRELCRCRCTCTAKPQLAAAFQGSHRCGESSRRTPPIAVGEGTQGVQAPHGRLPFGVLARTAPVTAA